VHCASQDSGKGSIAKRSYLVTPKASLWPTIMGCFSTWMDTLIARPLASSRAETDRIELWEGRRRGATALPWCHYSPSIVTRTTCCPSQKRYAR
jgi:hypothetical protein